MNCKNAQPLFDDLSDGRLPETLATEVRRHLDDCTDCRVLQQRGLRLQRLLALKRHELPGPEYFAGVLSEFHRRLDEELRPRATIWERLTGALTIEPARSWRFGFAGAMGLALAAAVVLMVNRPAHQSLASAQRNSKSSVFPSELAPENIAAALSSLPPDNQGGMLVPATVGNPDGSERGVMLLPATGGLGLDPLAPRYVLDRVTVSPAAYEVANVRF